MVFEGQYALAHHATEYRCVCTKDLSVASPHRTRPCVGVYDARIQTPRLFRNIRESRCHHWKSKPASRTRYHRRHRLDSSAIATLAESCTGCPICKSSKVVIDNLVQVLPEIAQEWHESKNGMLSPQSIGFKSTKMKDIITERTIFKNINVILFSSTKMLYRNLYI